MNWERTSWPSGHVIHMGNNGGQPLEDGKHYSIAQCDCGWRSVLPWDHHWGKQDAACEAHWREIEAARAAR